MFTPNTSINFDMEQRIQRLEGSVKRIEMLLAAIFNRNIITPVPEDQQKNNEETFPLAADDTNKQQQADGERQTNANQPPAQSHRKDVTSTMVMPTYSGKSDVFTAAEFLDRYELYWKVTKGNVSDDFKLNLVAQCLQGVAKLWRRAFSYMLTDWNQFKKLFLEHFWSSGCQHSFKEKLSFGRYEQKSDVSRMSEYFLLLINKAQYLDRPPTEADLVNRVSWHFPSIIQSRMHGLHKIVRAYEFLREEDRMRNLQREIDLLRATTSTSKSSCQKFLNLVSSGGGRCNGPLAASYAAEGSTKNDEGVTI